LISNAPQKQIRRKAPVGRLRRRRPVSRRRRFSVRTRLILVGLGLAGVVLASAILARGVAPRGNTSVDRFDTIIVLGTPADSEGNPTPAQLAGVTEAVHEYDRGVAPRLILTGGPAHNRYVEAQVMARVAEAQGIPASALVVEPAARDTIQNACYSVRLMKARGWRSAEVIAAPAHLPRAGLIFSRLAIDWRAHAAPSLEAESAGDHDFSTALEIVKTARYLVYADWAERCTP
jgi:uncharacterized SAM-binding protein YcdF (DUF218 family)